MIPGRGWVAGIAGIVVLSAAAAMVLLVTGSQLLARADAYFAQFDFSSSSPIEIDQPEYDRYVVISSQGYNLAAAASPFLLCAVAAGCILLAVLAHRYDDARRPRSVAD
jgi:hypothetical protein